MADALLGIIGDSDIDSCVGVFHFCRLYGLFFQQRLCSLLAQPLKLEGHEGQAIRHKSPGGADLPLPTATLPLGGQGRLQLKTHGTVFASAQFPGG